MIRALSSIMETFRKRGKQLFEKGYVVDFDHSSDIHYEWLETVDAVVESEKQYDKRYYVHFNIDPSGDMSSYECTCPFFAENRIPCKHIAAALYEYLYETEDPIGLTTEGKAQKPAVLHPTSRLITDFLSSYQKENVSLNPEPVTIYPIVLGFADESLGVELKVGRGSHSYVIKNISNFVNDVKNERTVRYGKFLNFKHTMSAFTPVSQKFLKFLISVSGNQDAYSERSPLDRYDYYYGSYSASFDYLACRTLEFRGRYLDEFVNIFKDSFVYLEQQKEIYQCVFTEGKPVLPSRLEKKDGYYVFSSEVPNYAKGKDLIIVDNTASDTLCIQKYDENLLHFYKMLKESKGTGFVINEADMVKFSKYLYPLIENNTTVEKGTFDPAEYTLEIPKSEMYLDAPQKDMILCKVKAVYSHGSYSIFDNENETKRDREEEQAFMDEIAPLFTSYDQDEQAYTLHGDDDVIFNFLQNTIPFLYEKGTVFISDRLQRMRVMSMPKVSMGVSFNHDLLQLHLISDTLPLDQIAEVLSKYNRKKKYYRLKNGTFLNMENADIDDILKMKDDLSLSRSDLASGNISLPKYRALYIEGMSERREDALEYEPSFADMLKNMKKIREENYDVPSGLQATLRPYQKEGMKWLCALRDNGFGGLLADDMGLGKTIQVISMLGNWKDRKRTLIVAPASLVYNWSQEIERFLPELPHRMIQGTPEERKQQIESSSENEVLITSYHILQRDIEYYEGMKFSCEVIDEAQFIKNANTLTSKAVKLIASDFRIALTGTPIENRLSELWSIFDYILPGFFGGYETFRKRYELPIMNQDDEDARKDLTRQITPFVLRRLKKDVLKDLPEKMEEVYYAAMEGEQKALYDAEVQKIKVLLESQTEQEFRESKITILAELTKLRMLCCNPDLVYEKYKENSAKTEMCIDMVKNAIEGGHKILLFSQFTGMLHEIEAALVKEGISTYLLEGKTPKATRARMVKNFQTDNVPVFLISLRAGGTGLNLTAADVVIHYDPWWNTAVEDQASDRAHRIGQKNVVTVYKLIMKDTIEERIIELQKEKSGLANRVLSGEGMSSAGLSREDLLSLLK